MIEKLFIEECDSCGGGRPSCSYEFDNYCNKLNEDEMIMFEIIMKLNEIIDAINEIQSNRRKRHE